MKAITPQAMRASSEKRGMRPSENHALTGGGQIAQQSAPGRDQEEEAARPDRRPQAVREVKGDRRSLVPPAPRPRGRSSRRATAARALATSVSSVVGCAATATTRQTPSRIAAKIEERAQPDQPPGAIAGFAERGGQPAEQIVRAGIDIACTIRRDDVRHQRERERASRVAARRGG